MTRTPEEIVTAFADTARLTPIHDSKHLDDSVTWRDALFTKTGSAWTLSHPRDPDRALLAALADEYAQLDVHVATLSDRMHLAWLTDVLGIDRLPVVPDRVVASASVEPKLAPAVVPQGTTLRGGKDAFGNERRYRTLDALTAHGATITGIRVLVPGGPTPGEPGSVYSENDYPITPISRDDAAHVAPHVMRISSPALAFPSGDMQVTITFAPTGATGAAAAVSALVAAARWRYPTAAGTLSAEATGTASGASVVVAMSGGCKDPAGGDPWIECVVPSGTAVPEDAEFSSVTIAVTHRSGVVPDSAFANNGLVDVTKEFQPFAATASKGDSFYVRSDEALSKAVDTLTVSAPAFAATSGGLLSTVAASEAAQAQTVMYVLNYHEYDGAEYGGSYVHNDLNWGLGTGGGATSGPSLTWQHLLPTGWSGFGLPLSGFAGTTGSLSGTGSVLSQVSGQQGRYVRCFISSGDLGWAAYQLLLANFATTAVKAPTTVGQMPQPITPAKFGSLTLSYTTIAKPATKVESWSGWRHLVMTTGVFHPFRRSVDDTGSTGMVAVGLSIPDAATGRSVSLYVQLDSASPCGATDRVAASWQWWDGAQWRSLLAADGTSRLRESGLVRFVAPKGWAEGCEDVSAASGRWIRMVTDQPDRLGVLYAIIPDAVIAEFVSSAQDPQTDPSPASALPVGTIKGTLAPIAGVKKMTNLASVRGRGPESDPDYARRASALVRHRGRAITAWDYEQMVAIEFPEVAAVRCLPHTDSEGEPAPGRVGLVLIPDEPTHLAPRPSVSLSGRVTDALTPVMPVGAQVSVLCPCYRPVTVTASIRLREGVAAITGTANITAALELMLHPTGTTPTRWGVQLYNSTLIAALERLPDVDVVLDFAMTGPSVVGDTAIVDPLRGLYCSSGDHKLTCEEQL